MMELNEQMRNECGTFYFYVTQMLLVSYVKPERTEQIITPLTLYKDIKRVEGRKEKISSVSSNDH